MTQNVVTANRERESMSFILKRCKYLFGRGDCIVARINECFRSSFVND